MSEDAMSFWAGFFVGGCLVTVWGAIADHDRLATIGVAEVAVALVILIVAGRAYD